MMRLFGTFSPRAKPPIRRNSLGEPLPGSCDKHSFKVMQDNNHSEEWASEAELQESLEMLKTRVGQINAVFACFGSAAQHAQFFEVALAEFLRDYNKVANEAITLQDLELLNKKLQKKTLGALLNEFSRYVTIKDPKVVQFLELALDRRNFLMHHFFPDRSIKLQSEDGRMSLLSELVSIDCLLQEAATIVRGMNIAMSRAIAKQSDPEAQADDADKKVLFTAEVKLP